MKKTLCMILLCCVVTISFAKSNNPSISSKIEQTADLQVIKREIVASPKDTLVVFDIDLVLITPSDEIFILCFTDEGQKLLVDIHEDLWNRLPLHDVEEMQSILMLTQPWRPVTTETAKIFNQIKANGYKVLGLTASSTGTFGKIRSMEKWRTDELKSVGITFDKYFINAKSGSLDSYIPNIGEYYAKARHACFPAAENGIIFTCTIPKGETLDAYLQFAKIKPKKIIFIDDRLNNLETVREYCKQSNIEFIGYEYTAIKEQAKRLKLNPRRTRLQFKILELTKTWLNDTQIDTLLVDINK